MSNFSTFIITTASIPYLWFALVLSYPKAVSEDPIAYVEVVEDEIEIEYINPPTADEIERAKNFE
mgnify:CR=1 FL=1|tara:strand:+ start:352 stop:546 length:195 start_codon:yes stop_codon:yes gene_type:complete